MAISTSKEAYSGRLFYWGYDGVKPIGEGAKRVMQAGVLEAVTLGNVVDVEANETHIAIVAMDRDLKQSFGLSVYVLHTGPDAKPITIRVPGIIRASLSPDGKMAALGICNSNGCQLEIVGLNALSTIIWKRALTDRITSVAWNPRNEKVAYVTADSGVHIVDVGRDGEVTMDGSEIGWSPTGDRLAIARGNNIVVYSSGTKTEKTLLSRAFWKNRIVGRISWAAPDTIAFNTPSGIDGNKLTCNFYDVASGSVTTMGDGYSFCGLVQ